MQLDEVKTLLRAIEVRDRKPFPEGAARVWLEDFESVELADAMIAVREYFRLTEENRRGTLLPGTIRRRALELAEARQRKEQLVIERAKGEPDPPNAEYRAALAALAGRMGDLERDTPRVRPDTSTPQLDGEAARQLEAERRRQLAALREMASA
jgi:hypothetical protein